LFVAAFGPGIVALIVAAITGGGPSVRKLLQRILVWRVGLVWWVVVLVLPGVAALGAVLIGGPVGGSGIHLGRLAPVYTVIPPLVVLTLLNGAGEEWGWRGFV
jgi:membrane protease YdiL (CAAX protease family)